MPCVPQPLNSGPPVYPSRFSGRLFLFSAETGANLDPQTHLGYRSTTASSWNSATGAGCSGPPGVLPPKGFARCPASSI